LTAMVMRDPAAAHHPEGVISGGRPVHPAGRRRATSAPPDAVATYVPENADVITFIAYSSGYVRSFTV
jgi:hypothetical protein